MHQPLRFAMLAALAKAQELEFRFLRDTLDVTDSVLSRHAATLEEAGLVEIRKRFVGKWPRTWLALTDEGRQAFAEHLAALEEIVGSELLG